MHKNLAYEYFPSLLGPTLKQTYSLKLHTRSPIFSTCAKKVLFHDMNTIFLSNFNVICKWAAPKNRISFAPTRCQFTPQFWIIMTQQRPLVIIINRSSFSFLYCNEEHFPMGK